MRDYRRINTMFSHFVIYQPTSPCRFKFNLTALSGVTGNLRSGAKMGRAPASGARESHCRCPRPPGICYTLSSSMQAVLCAVERLGRGAHGKCSKRASALGPSPLACKQHFCQSIANLHLVGSRSRLLICLFPEWERLSGDRPGKSGSGRCCGV
jgi:hypothetical protein